MHIPYAPMIMSVIILTAVLSCLNSAFYVSSRVLFILADKRRRTAIGSCDLNEAPRAGGARC